LLFRRRRRGTAPAFSAGFEGVRGRGGRDEGRLGLLLLLLQVFFLGQVNLEQAGGRRGTGRRRRRRRRRRGHCLGSAVYVFVY
jgi:hypothetical protein